MARRPPDERAEQILAGSPLGQEPACTAGTHAAIENPDLTLGYLVGGTEPVEHPAVEGVEEVSHYETVTEYPGGGRDVRKVIDVPGVPAQAAWTEQVPVQRYIRYTEEELAAREKERQQAEEAARLPETIASLTCQLTDLQLALCELYED